MINQKKALKVRKIPTGQDVEKLWLLSKEKLRRSLDLLLIEKNHINYERCMYDCCGQVMLFAKKRSGEVSRIMIKDIEKGF